MEGRVPLCTKDAIKSLTSDAVYRRGLELAASSKLSDVQYEGHNLMTGKATCQGSQAGEVYQVHFCLEDSMETGKATDTVTFTCTCPAAERGICKHSIAFFLRRVDQLGEEAQGVSGKGAVSFFAGNMRVPSQLNSTVEEASWRGPHMGGDTSTRQSLWGGGQAAVGPSPGARTLPPWMLTPATVGVAASGGKHRGAATERVDVNGSTGVDTLGDIGARRGGGRKGGKGKRGGGGSEGDSPKKGARGGRGDSQRGRGSRGGRRGKRKWEEEEWSEAGEEDEIEEVEDSVVEGADGDEEPEVVDADVVDMPSSCPKTARKGQHSEEPQHRSARGTRKCERRSVRSDGRGRGERGGRQRKLVVEEDEILDSEEAAESEKEKGKGKGKAEGDSAALGWEVEMETRERREELGGRKMSTHEQDEGSSIKQTTRLASLFKCSRGPEATRLQHGLHGGTTAEETLPPRDDDLCNTNTSRQSAAREDIRDAANSVVEGGDAADELLALLFPMTGVVAKPLKVSRQEDETSDTVVHTMDGHGKGLERIERRRSSEGSVRVGGRMTVEENVGDASCGEERSSSLVHTQSVVENAIAIGTAVVSHARLQTTISSYVLSSLEATRANQVHAPRRSLKDRVSKLL